ncbi:MAG TPA: ABC transporter permease, partial [Blastocatellia bacterium]|nr:ABC transporter permease [Blastocatellia bacterium]
MKNLAQDIRYALRVLRRSRAFTGLAILALALGIGAVTTVLSLVNAILLKPLGYPSADRIVAVWEWRENPFSVPDFENLRDYSRSFEQLSMIHDYGFNLTGDQAPESVDGFRVSANFFRVLGTTPAIGRTFLEGEDQPGANRIAVISDRLWRNRFSSDPGICGRTARLDGEDYTIVGVTPPDFISPYHRVDIFTP